MTEPTVKTDVFSITQDADFEERLKRLYLYRTDPETPNYRTVKLGTVSDPLKTPRIQYEKLSYRTLRAVGCKYIEQQEAIDLHYDPVLIAALWKLLGVTTLRVGLVLEYEIEEVQNHICVTRHQIPEDFPYPVHDLTPAEVEAYNNDVVNGFRGTTEQWRIQTANITPPKPNKERTMNCEKTDNSPNTNLPGLHPKTKVLERAALIHKLLMMSLNPSDIYTDHSPQYTQGYQGSGPYGGPGRFLPTRTVEAPMITRMLTELSQFDQYEYALLELGIVVGQNVNETYRVKFNIEHSPIIIAVGFDHQREIPPFPMG